MRQQGRPATARRGGDRLSRARRHRDELPYDYEVDTVISASVPATPAGQQDTETEAAREPSMTNDDDQGGAADPESSSIGAEMTSQQSLASSNIRPLPSIPDDIAVPEEPFTIPPDNYDLPSLGGLVDDHVLIDELPPPPPRPDVYEDFPASMTRYHALGLIVLGSGCIICQAVAINLVRDDVYETDWFNYLPSGLLGGVYFIICGIVTILSANYKTKRMIKISVMLLSVGSSIICAYLFIMCCIGLTMAQSSDRYQCKTVKTPGRTFKRCPLSPMLIVNIALLVLSIMVFTISTRLSVQGYKIVLGKQKNRIQCIRTPEGHVIMLNRGPSYSGDPDLLPSMILRTKTADILFPMQTEAVMKPPPYAVDEKGNPAPPPKYKEQPPLYSNKATHKVTFDAHSEQVHLEVHASCQADRAPGTSSNQTTSEENRDVSTTSIGSNNSTGETNKGIAEQILPTYANLSNKNVEQADDKNYVSKRDKDIPEEPAMIMIHTETNILNGSTHSETSHDNAAYVVDESLSQTSLEITVL